MNASHNAALPALRVDRLYKRYGDFTAVDGISLEVARGDFFGFLGPNGAGKTTTIRMILGLAAPTGGDVRVFGRDPRDSAARVRIGTMLQSAEMPATLTVREHITLFSSYYPAPLPIDDVIRLAALDGLENRRAQRLSGGQRQRLAFALAICGDPDLLVLDEPTSGLDIESRVMLWDRIRVLAARGKSIIITTHHLAEADALADRIAFIARGSIVADGTPAEIKERAGTRELEAAYLALTKVQSLEAIS
jgi:ABC-2 type transport system ATP-binding protein